MTSDGWLAAHPYLRPVADLHALVERTSSEIRIPPPRIPHWDDYVADFHAGVPLLRSADAAIDLEPTGEMIQAVVARLASDRLDGALYEDLRGLNAELEHLPDAPARIANWMLGDDAWRPAFNGLLRFVGWIAAARHLQPLVDAFGGWRDEDRWLRRYCPTCGSLPAMAQLLGLQNGRVRLLSCGCCDTRWRYSRTGCPFCEVQSHRLAAIVTGEAGLRIDYCESCQAYLKTYDGHGREALLLADWTSLHLDVLARDHGLKRQAASLYELDPMLPS
jgi:FdhE protein